MRLKARIDSNHSAVVKALRACGCSVQSLASLGHGVVDLLVGRNGVNFLMEIKDGSKSPSQRKLTPDELEWIAAWKGKAHVVHSVEEAIKVVNNL